MCKKLLLFTAAIVLLLGFAGQATADPNLMGHWEFNGNANDSSGNGNNGTLYGDHSSYVSGMIAQALNLDPNDDDDDDPNNAYVVVPDDNSLDFGKGSFSITLWIKYDPNVNNRGVLVTKGKSDGFWGWGDGGPGYRLQYYDTAFYMYISDGTAQQVMAGNSRIEDDSEWHQVAALCHRPAVGMNSMGIYVDGIARGIGAITFPGDINSPNDLYIGCNGINGGEYADAAIDDVRIYNYSINPAEAFEVFAYDPSPEDGGQYVATDADLMWNPGMSSERFDVYFGTNESNVNDANTTTTLGVYKSNQDANSFDPNDPTAADLLPDKTYYWRIDSLDDANNVLNKGDVWTFDSMLTKAHNPDPANNRQNILLEQVLSWSAGYGSSTHDVYFGTNESDVTDANTTNPLGVLKSIGQSDPNFDPNDPTADELLVNTTYYWRIDEVSGGTIKGDVWNFTTIVSIDPNLMIHLTFDEGEGIYASDYSGHGNTGTLHSGATWIASALGGAIDFDGDEGRVEVQDDESISFGTKSFSIAFWVKSDVRGGRLLMNGSSGGGGESGNRYEVDFSGGGYGQMAFILDEEGVGKDGVGTGAVFATGEWVHAVCVRDVKNARMRIYKNSLVVGTTTPNHNGQDTNSPGENMFIACDEDPGSFMEGSLDDFRIYNYVLSQDEIEELASKEAFPPAWGPVPDDEATNVRLHTELGWNKGVWAQSHDVYFGTSWDDVNDANTTVDPNDVYKENIFVTSWDPATDGNYSNGLEKNKTYYWRIDEVNVPVGNKYNKGNVWSFTTADTIIVDDMELYGNSPDPCDVWKDGTRAPWDTSGSAVFLQKGDFVHLGIQSMKYTYQNDGLAPTAVEHGKASACYSEIEASTTGTDSLDCGSDWTRDDSKALTLYFYGDPNNDVVGDANVMYVVIEDGDGSDANAMIKYGSYNTEEEDVNDVNDESWHEWNIALDDFNTPNDVNLANIAKVYIGFGRRGEPDPYTSLPYGRPGGSGTVYFDDIRLYQSRCVAIYNSDVDLNNDCDIDYDDIDVLQNSWLDVNTVAINPGDSNLVAHYEFEDDANDSTGNIPDQNGVEYGNPSYNSSSPKVGSYSIVFDPTDADDYVVVEDVKGTIAAEFSTESFSVAMWIKTSNDGQDGIVLCNGTDGTGAGTVSGNRYETRFGHPYFFFDIDDHSNKTENLIISTLVATGEWVHVAGVRDTAIDRLKLYIDGVLRGIVSDDTENTISSPNEPLVMGAKPGDMNDVSGEFDTYDEFYTGELDDVRIYDKALTVGEVIYLASEGGPTPDDMKHNADLNLDNFVNLKDYAVLADAWLDDYRWP